MVPKLYDRLFSFNYATSVKVTQIKDFIYDDARLVSLCISSFSWAYKSR